MSIQETPRGDGAALQTGEASTGELLRGIVEDATTLVRQEILLARQEVTEGLVTGAKGGALLAGAGVFGLLGFGFGLTTVALAIGGPLWLGFLIVTGGLLLPAAVLGLLGRHWLAASKLAPEQARAELRETATELKKEIRWAPAQPQPPAKSS